MKENINNLTTLWETVSRNFDSFFSERHYNYCFIRNSGWPNRIWLARQDTNYVPDEVINILKSKQDVSSFSLFTENSKLNNFPPEAEKHLQEKSTQYGMDLQLKECFEHSSDVELQRVKSEEDALLWCDMFTRSFGYIISSETVLRTIKDVEYYLVIKSGDVSGTIILFGTATVLGIHALGVTPEMRGKGIAMDVMKLVLNNGFKQGYNTAALQASDMAKNMYLKLGFEEKFILTNYTLRSK